MKKKLLLIALIAVLVIAFFAFDLHELLTLQTLKASQERFAGWREASPWLVGFAFFTLYVIVTALSVPGAAVMTIAAGTLFSLFSGSVIVSFASSIGATLAFLIARFLLREPVQRRFGGRLKAIDEGIKREGAFYLFTLRLVPLFPFFAVNVLMGLTAIRAVTFYWVSQLGMLPATIIYVNAGTQLGQLETLSGVLSPKILGSLVLLGLFPLVARRVPAAVKKHRVYAKWSKPKRFDRNLVVIGAGAAGLVTSYIAAAVRASVTLIEGSKMGGDCLNYGCVPSKALIRSAKLAHQMRHADRYGLQSIQPDLDFRTVMARVHGVIRAVQPHDSVERYTALGVEVLQGYARIVDPWTVEATLPGGKSRRITTRSIVIAAGAEPVVPPIPGMESTGYVTTDTIWERFGERADAPRRLIVLGGGPVGCELAQSFARLGSHVTQIQRGPRLMPREDEDVAELVQAALQADGIEVLTNHKAVRCERDGQRKFLVVEQHGAERRIEFDELLCATGRRARLHGYGLEELGIPTERTVETNEYLETIYPNILAAGDVSGPYQFTHAAGHQGWYAAVNGLFGQLKKFKADYSVMPWTTFTDPEVAHVGMNEHEAKQQGVEYEVTRYDLAELDRAIADSATRGFIKVLTVPGKDRILGATLVSEHAGEMIPEFVLAMKHGLGLGKILGTIHTYPTFAEANKYVAGEWRRRHAPQRLLEWVGRYHAWRRG